jgi:CRP-like cAMP-binding protein
MDKAELWKKKQLLTRGHFLVSQGDRGQDLFWVKSGAVRAYIMDGDKELTIRFGYSGSFISPLDSFITNRPTELWIQVIRKAEVLSIDKTTFYQFIKTDKHRLNLWLEIIEMVTYQQFEREIDLLKSSPAERLHRVLERSPGVFQEIPHKYIASYLRMTPETLSRLQKS